MNDPIDVWFHCWCGNHKFKISTLRILKYINNKIDKLKKSELYDHLNKFYLVAHGVNNLNEFIFDEISSLHKKIEIIKMPIGDIGHEADTLNLIIDKYRDTNINFNILFFHTKGFSYPELPTHENWIRHMDFYLICKWREHQKILESYDTSGMGLFAPDDLSKKDGEPENRKTYPGFFWWSKSSHVKTLEKFTYWMDRGKGGEFGLITENCKYHVMDFDHPEGFDFHKHVWCNESSFDEGW